MKIRMFGQTHRGRVRSENQDYFYLSPTKGFCIVCDGIGGRQGGAEAAQLAVNSMREALVNCQMIRAGEIHSFLLSTVDQINRYMTMKGYEKFGSTGMGTTLNAVFFVGHNMYIAHVGDSRTYLLQNNHFWQLTVDHNLAIYVERGWLPPEVLKGGAKPQALVRALGLSKKCEPDIYEKDLAGDELLLTCSDGLTSMLSDAKIKKILIDNREQLDKIPDVLIHEANKKGGKDNITVVITEVSKS